MFAWIFACALHCLFACPPRLPLKLGFGSGEGRHAERRAVGWALAGQPPGGSMEGIMGDERAARGPKAHWHQQNSRWDRRQRVNIHICIAPRLTALRLQNGGARGWLPPRKRLVGVASWQLCGPQQPQTPAVGAGAPTHRNKRWSNVDSLLRSFCARTVQPHASQSSEPEERRCVGHTTRSPAVL